MSFCYEKSNILTIKFLETKEHKERRSTLNNETIFLAEAEQNDEETFQLSIELRSYSFYDSGNTQTHTDAIKMTFSLTLACKAITLIVCLYVRIGYLKMAMLYCNNPAKANSNNSNN